MSRIVGALLVGGLVAHLIAAQLNGGSGIAYMHHIAGFFIIAAVTGLPLLGLTRLFWRNHFNRALLIFAVIQFVLGVMVAAQEWRKH